MAEYYVANDGNDVNAGTVVRPWRTIQHAVKHVAPGDTCFVRAGVYAESVSLGVSGQKDAPITLTPYTGELVTIDGGAGAALIDRSDTAWWSVLGFVLASAGELTVDLGAWGWCETCHWVLRGNRILGSVGIFGSYNTLDGNEVDGRGSAWWGIKETGLVSHHNQYRNNKLHGCTGRAVWSTYFTHDSLFEGNHVYDMVGQGIDLDGYTTCVWRHTVRGNHIHDCGYNGVALENAYETVVENNIIHDNAGHGIEVINYGGDVGEPGQEFECRPDPSNQYGDTDGDNDCRGNITNNVIRQNLIYNMGYLGGVDIWYAGGVSVLGNTILHCRSGAGIDISLHTPETRVKSNIVIDCDWGNIKTQDTASLVEESHNFTQGNPLLDKDYRPMASSPVIDAGTDIGLETDLDGNPRPQGAGFDIGAYEFVEGAAPPAGIARIATWKRADKAAVLLEAGGRTAQLSREDLATHNTVEKIETELRRQTGGDISDFFLHLNRDGSLAVATGLPPGGWPEDNNG